MLKIENLKSLILKSVASLIIISTSPFSAFAERATPTEIEIIEDSIEPSNNDFQECLDYALQSYLDCIKISDQSQGASVICDQEIRVRILTCEFIFRN